MSQLLNQLAELKKYVTEHLTDQDRAALTQEVLGRKGRLSSLLRQLGTVSPEERARLGKEANQIKAELEALLSTNETSTISADLIDLSVPPLKLSQGTIHPISAMIEEMVGIFQDLSFEVVEGSELITDKENFENLNIHADHPARDGHDSFYVKNNLLLRTHTTAIQVGELTRRIKNRELPVRIVATGKCYRRESDQTHSAMFHQIDAVMVDEQTTFADLKGCLDYFAKRLFGDLVETRFRPHFFPFTEPSAEVDIRWKGEKTGEGKQTGWLEFGGCGMIHPKVLERAGINPKIYQGWAFGLSVERPIMLRKQIPDLRRFYENSLDFLEQFSA